MLRNDYNIASKSNFNSIPRSRILEFLYISEIKVHDPIICIMLNKFGRGCFFCVLYMCPSILLACTQREILNKLTR